MDTARSETLGVPRGKSYARSYRDSGFTVMEVIGVMTVIAIMAAAIFPSIIRRIDHAAATREKSDLNAIADSYTQFILRKKAIPDTNTWATDIAGNMYL